MASQPKKVAKMARKVTATADPMVERDAAPGTEGRELVGTMPPDVG
jgi:hypothetical protein